MWSRFLYTAFFLNSLLTAVGQDIRLKMYTSEDGLSNNVVRNITQDKFGQVWIGTEHGLSKFNGHEFVTYTHNPADPSSISHNVLFGLDTDKSGNVWVGTDFGLNVLSQKQESFCRFLNSESETSLSNNHVRAVFVDDDNNVWVGTEDGLNVFAWQDSTFLRKKDDRVFEDAFGRSNLSYNRINTIIQDTEGHIWVGSDGGSIKVYGNSTGSFSPLQIPAGKSNYLFNIIRTIYQAADGTFWIGTDGGLVHYNQEIEKFKVYHPSNRPDSLGFKYIWGIVEDLEKKLWVSSYGGGLYTLNRKSGRFKSHAQAANRTPGYADNLIWPLFKDRDHNIWVGFDGNLGLGLYNAHDTGLNHLLGSAEQSERVYVSNIIEISPDSLLVDTAKERCLIINKKRKSTLNLWKNDTYREKISLKLASGYLLAELDKVFVTDNTFKVQFSIEDDSIGMITCGLQDPTGNVWLGTLSMGLIKLNLQSRQIERYLTEPTLNVYHDSRSIASMYLGSDSTLWIGAVRSGLIALNIKNGEKSQYHFDQDGFSELTINAIEKNSEQQLWLGSRESGLLQFDINTGKIAIANPSLKGEQILELIQDQSNRLWISTAKGLLMFNSEEDSLIRFGIEDGLQSKIFNRASHSGKSGLLYFGGENGLNWFDPNEISLDKRTKPILVEGIGVNGSKIKLSANENIFEIDKLLLSHDENDIAIAFSANTFSHANQSIYEYKLNDSEWRLLNNQRELLLSNLSPGNYTLSIRSENHDGIKSEERIISLTISPPWYSTWWFRITVSVVFAAAVSLYFYTRIQRVRKQKQHLEQVVLDRTKELELSKKQVEEDKITIEKALEERESLLKEIHHRVKNNLQIIASLLYLQSGKFEDEDYKKVLEEGQGRVRSMALIHQKLYENEDLKSIPFGEYLQELVGEIRASFGQEMSKVELNIEAENIFFDVDTAVPLGLIVNELATNAFKYAYREQNGGSFSIFLTEEDGTYILNVKDDGSGIPDEIDIRKAKSLGLRLVRMLSQQLEGDFSIDSQEGTTFNLKFAA